MSRADKITRRRGEREAFLRSRPLVCCECGVRFINDEMAALARRTGVTDTLCDDCSWEADLTGWTVEKVEP